jgi:hypothetical protein
MWALGFSFFTLSFVHLAASAANDGAGITTTLRVDSNLEADWYVQTLL